MNKSHLKKAIRLFLGGFDEVLGMYGMVGLGDPNIIRYVQEIASQLLVDSRLYTDRGALTAMAQSGEPYRRLIHHDHMHLLHSLLSTGCSIHLKAWQAQQVLQLSLQTYFPTITR